MRIRLSFVIIPALTVAVAWMGSFFTILGMSFSATIPGWFDTLVQPTWAPPDWIFGPVWTALFVLTAIAALIVWNTFPRNRDFEILIWLFVANAFANVFWSFLFFTQHLVGLAVLDAIVLEMTVLALMVISWRYSRVVSYLLLPYALWVLFAIALNTAIWTLN